MWFLFHVLLSVHTWFHSLLFGEASLVARFGYHVGMWVLVREICNSLHRTGCSVGHYQNEWQAISEAVSHRRSGSFGWAGQTRLSSKMSHHYNCGCLLKMSLPTFPSVIAVLIWTQLPARFGTLSERVSELRVLVFFPLLLNQFLKDIPHGAWDVDQQRKEDRRVDEVARMIFTIIITSLDYRRVGRGDCWGKKGWEGGGWGDSIHEFDETSHRRQYGNQ